MIAMKKWLYGTLILMASIFFTPQDSLLASASFSMEQSTVAESLPTTDALRAEFYKEHPWLYLKYMLKLVPPANEVVRSDASSKAFWIPFGLCVLFVMSNNYYDLQYALRVGAMLGVPCGGFIWSIAQIASSNAWQDNISQALDALFIKYNHNLIPQELRPTFDMMHKKYQQNKSAFLKEAIVLIRAIKQLVDCRVQGIEGV